ncbi:MAG: aldo/keto reductase, partial [Ignavibacteriae bacterium]|nr:aldo/keto reductase [Ignavibacteriota bacterium]
QVINEGKAFYWGTSEWTATQIMEAYQIARREHLIPPLMEQPEYSMLHREKVEKEFLPLYDKIGLGTTIWSPLKSGFLTGKYNDGIPEKSRLAMESYEWLKNAILSEEGKKNIVKVKELTKVANDLGITMSGLALAWTLKNPNVSTTITGASKPEQVKENMKAMGYVAMLTEEVMEKIEEILQNKPIPERDWKG